MKNELGIRWVQRLTILCFGLVLAVPLVFMNHKKDQVSAIDNRNLTELPETMATRTGRAQFASYLEDRIGFRTEMITADTMINDTLFHVMEHPTYTYGKDDWVFLKVPYEWSINYPYISAYCYLVEAVMDYCEEQDITFQYWLNPSKMRIYDEYMPDGVHMKWAEAEYLLEYLEELQVPYTWTADCLKQASEDTLVYNKQYDAGHWNDTGAFLGNQTLIQDLIDRGVDIEPLDEAAFSKKEITYETLPVSFFPIHDTTIKYERKEPQAEVDPSYNDTVELDPAHPEFIRYVNEQNPDAPKLLLFRGSYMDGREYFLSDTFSELTAVESYGNIRNFRYYIDLFQPDVVVFECAEYVINEEMFPYEVLYEGIGEE